MEFKIGQFYAHANILLMPLEILEKHPYAQSFGRYPDYAIKFWRIQTIFHMDKYTNKEVIYEIYEEGNDRAIDNGGYIYEDEWQERIDFDEIREADIPFKRKHIEGIFTLEKAQF